MSHPSDTTLVCRVARRSDKETVVTTLAEAFRHEPAFAFMVPDPAARRKALLRAFGIVFAESIQPGQLIGGTPSENVIAAYTQEAGDNIDAAIATLNSTRPFDTKILLTDVVLTGVRVPQQGDILEKSGSRTEVTKAQVLLVKGHRVRLVPIGGDRPGAPNISKSGDSGSVWCYPGTGEAAVLHTYGDPENDHTQEWAGGYLMSSVVEALEISMVPI